MTGSRGVNGARALSRAVWGSNVEFDLVQTLSPGQTEITVSGTVRTTEYASVPVPVCFYVVQVIKGKIKSMNKLI